MSLNSESWGRLSSLTGPEAGSVPPEPPKEELGGPKGAEGGPAGSDGPDGTTGLGVRFMLLKGPDKPGESPASASELTFGGGGSTAGAGSLPLPRPRPLRVCIGTGRKVWYKVQVKR